MPHNETELEAFDRIEMEYNHRLVTAQIEKLKKLNKAELFVLAKHFKITHYEDFAENWSRYGKDELCEEIAQIMVGDEEL